MSTKFVGVIVSHSDVYKQESGVLLPSQARVGTSLSGFLVDRVTDFPPKDFGKSGLSFLRSVSTLANG